MVLSSETLERSRVELYHLHLGHRKAAFPDNQVRSKYKLLVLFARYKIWMIACVLVCAYPAAEHLLFQGPWLLKAVYLISFILSVAEEAELVRGKM